MILLSSPLKNEPLETMVSIFFSLEIEIFRTRRVNSKRLKKICRQLLSTMNVLKSAYKKTDSTIVCVPCMLERVCWEPFPLKDCRFGKCLMSIG